MKKTLLGLIFAFGITTSNFAQEFNYGIKGGINFSTLRGQEHSRIDRSFKNGIHAGIFIEFPIAKRMAIQPELLFSSKGVNEEWNAIDNGVNILFKTNLSLNYISLPVLYKYYITEKLTVHGGPQLNFLISSKLKTNIKLNGRRGNLAVNSDVGDELDVKKDYNNLDLGFNLGISYGLGEYFFITGSYNLGLISIDKNDEEPTTKKGKNSVIQASVGIKFL